MRTRITILKPIDERRTAWTETPTWGWPTSDSRGLSPEESADLGQGRMVVEGVPRRVAAVNDVIPYGAQYFRIVGIIPRPDAPRVVDLECDQTKGSFRIADELTFGADQLTFGGDDLVFAGVAP